jgi:peptidoglycan-N-acetylglucosamine deacetylase
LLHFSAKHKDQLTSWQVIQHLTRNSMQKSFYLTIDDGPSVDFSAKCSYLYEKNIPAIFFCIGANLEKHADAVIDAINKGFLIANHSYSHPRFSSISVNQAREEIQRTDALIDELYRRAGRERSKKHFRFPYGDNADGTGGKIFSKKIFRKHKNAAALQSILDGMNYEPLEAAGVTYPYYQQALQTRADCIWTFDTMDWSFLHDEPQQAFEQTKQRLKQTSPHDFRGYWNFGKRWLASASDEIILMHDHEKSAPFFMPLMELLREISTSFLLPGHPPGGSA